MAPRLSAALRRHADHERPNTVGAGLLTFVAVLALWQLGFARQILLAAFLIVFGSLGVAFALAAGLGSARALDREWDVLFARRDRPLERRSTVSESAG